MNIQTELLQQIDAPGASYRDKVRARCRLAHELEEAGNYEGAPSALGPLWLGVGVRPPLADLDAETAAEVLLRVGVISGFLGKARQLEGAQEAAKDLISEARAAFEALGIVERGAEALTDLGVCYWRAGAVDEARVVLNEALERLAARRGEQWVVTTIRLAIVESSATRARVALQLLELAAPVVEACAGHALRGKYHMNLAAVLTNLHQGERAAEYCDRALVESAAASYHFEQAGHVRYRAGVENNIGYLLFSAGRFSAAHEHLDRAKRLYAGLREARSVAQVDETRARTLLAERRNADAERIVRAAVRVLDTDGDRSIFVEALTTHGVALARLRRRPEAEQKFRRAIEVAEQAGDAEGAGLATLALLEELGADLPSDEATTRYRQADALLANAQRADILSRLRVVARQLLDRPQEHDAARLEPAFVHADDKTAHLLAAARQLAHLPLAAATPVLITGETGTGKEVLARMIHRWSGRRGPFVAINCAALPEPLLESLLFGHRKGSFTDAHSDHPGAVRQAEAGTLLLDEIGELSPRNQASVLRLVERGEIQPVGAAQPERVDVRIVAATNRKLQAMVAAGQFRQDLYFRLNIFELNLPPLRERPADIAALAAHFVAEILARYQKRVIFTPEAVALMQQLPLKGNARELRSIIERCVLLTPTGERVGPETVSVVSLQPPGAPAQPGARPTTDAAWAGCNLEAEVHEFERNMIRLALQQAGGRVTHAAQLLGLTHQGLTYTLKGRHQELLTERKPARIRRRRITTRAKTSAAIK